jgi:rhodanese-related sulfurtransferase
MIRSLLSRVRARVFGGARAGASPTTEAPAANKTGARVGVSPPPAETLARTEAGAQEVKERLDAGERVTIVDVRTPAETEQGIIPGAKLIPLDELEDRWIELQACDEVVCYCASGGRSLRAARLLHSRGLFNATSLVGGIAAWKAAGGAVVNGGPA